MDRVWILLPKQVLTPLQRRDNILLITSFNKINVQLFFTILMKTRRKNLNNLRCDGCVAMCRRGRASLPRRHSHTQHVCAQIDQAILISAH